MNPRTFRRAQFLTVIPLTAAILLSLSGAPTQATTDAAPRGQHLTQDAPTYDVTGKTWDDMVIERSYDHLIIVDFYKAACGACSMLDRFLKPMARDADGQWFVARVSGSTDPRLAKENDVTEYPTLVAYRDGEEIDRLDSDTFFGNQPETAAWIASLLADG